LKAFNSGDPAKVEASPTPEKLAVEKVRAK
jgi:hypothetical protein